jgi:hypothetical protein
MLNPAVVFEVSENPSTHEVKIVQQPTILPDTNVTKAYNPPQFTRTEAVNPRKWAEWGAWDNLPRWIYERLTSVPFAMTIIWKQVLDMLGARLVYYKRIDIAKGFLQEAYVPEIEDFLEKNAVREEFLPNHILSLKLFFNAFAQGDLSIDKSKIIRIYHLEAAHCRLCKQDQNNWEINWLYLCGRFGIWDVPADSDLKTFPLYRRYKENFFEWLRGDSFAFHTKMPSPGATYYARPLWLSLLEDGSWLDVAKKVPTIVSALQNNQMLLRYHILVSEDYFKFRHSGGKWESYTQEDKEKHYATFKQNMEGSLTGVENQGKTIVTFCREENGKKIGTVEIIPIDDKMKGDAWIPSAATANNEIGNALGTHNSQYNSMSEGGKMGAGSGSDARVHFNSGVLRNTPEQTIALQFLNMVAQFNKWDIVFAFRDFAQSTTDVATDGVPASTNQTKKPNNGRAI